VPGYVGIRTERREMLGDRISSPCLIGTFEPSFACKKTSFPTHISFRYLFSGIYLRQLYFGKISVPKLLQETVLYGFLESFFSFALNLVMGLEIA
jgi:hypothetical protein